MIYRINIYEQVKGEKFKKLLKLAFRNTEIISLERYPNVKLTEDNLYYINDEYIEYVEFEDEKVREKFIKDKEFRANMLEIFDGDEKRVEEHFNEIVDKSLEIINDEGEFDYDFDLEDIFFPNYQEDENIVHYPKEYWEKGEFRSHYGDVLETFYSRITSTNIGLITEITNFSGGRIYKELLEQMNSLYTRPLLIDGYLFENPSFLGKDRVILAINSNGGFTFMNLDEDEYLDFLDLNIDHTVEQKY